MSAELACDDALLHRLPLPLAQLARRAHNAKTPIERQLTAFYLWEATLKLQAVVAVAEYARSGVIDPLQSQRLQTLARPALGHWWECVRGLIPVLAGRMPAAFGPIHELLFGPARADCPRTAELDTALREALGETGETKATIRIGDVIERLVNWRNAETGPATTNRQPGEFSEELGNALLAAATEVLSKLDVLGGQRLLYVAAIERLASGNSLIDAFELTGESPHRLQSVELAGTDPSQLPQVGGIYLAESNRGQPVGRGWTPVRPLLLYRTEASRVFFLHTYRGQQHPAYLCYATGETIPQDEPLAEELRAFLPNLVGGPVTVASIQSWEQATQADELDTRPVSAQRTMGEFTLLSQLGRGGMGIVYRAWQPSLGREVALKCLLHAGDPRAEARFAREIRALGRVDHPHLVKVFTSGSAGDQWFFAMELVEGASLASICDRFQHASTSVATVDMTTWKETLGSVCAELRQSEKPLSDGQHIARSSSRSVTRLTPAEHQGVPVAGRGYLKQVVRLIYQVAQAAHALHEAGIIHRDIKPGNIMVSADGEHAVLMDLGLAQLSDEEAGRVTRSRQFVGTVRYASPEQVLAVERLDRRCDVYSLGATLWELLTLRPLFGASEQMPIPELMRHIQFEEPEPVRKYHPGIPPDLEAIVANCLEKEPGRRYSSALDLARDLERFLKGEPVRVRPIGRAERAWRFLKRRPLESALVAVTVIGLTVFGITFVREQIHQQHAAREAQYNKQLEQAHAETLGALDDVFNSLTDNRLARIPELDYVRAKMLKHYQKFVEEHEGDPRFRRRLGTFYIRLGDIAAKTGKKQDAAAEYAKAEAIYRDLASRQADDTELQDRLAQAYLGRGEARSDLGEWSGAEADLERARTLLKPLQAQKPDDQDVTRHLAEVEHTLGIFYNRQARFPEALAAYQRSLELRETLIKLNPQRRRYRRDLARSHGYMGDVYATLADWDKARKAYEISRDIRQRLVTENPKDTEARFQLGRGISNLGNLARMQNQTDEAIRAYSQVLDLQVALVADSPSIMEFQGDLGWTYRILGTLLTDAGRYEEAAIRLTEGQKLYQKLHDADREAVDYRRGLARTTAYLGKLQVLQGDTPTARATLEKARLAFDKLTPASLDSEDCYALALVRALRAELEPPDQRTPTDSPQGALTALQDAVTKGFRNADYLAKDRSFERLAADPAFLKVLDSIRSKAKGA